MTTSFAYAYAVVIETEDECRVSIEFESTDELSEDQQKDKAKQILLDLNDDVESDMVYMSVQPAKTVRIETVVDGAITQTTKTYST
jgi:hypothetical protein